MAFRAVRTSDAISELRHCAEHTQPQVADSLRPSGALALLSSDATVFMLMPCLKILYAAADTAFDSRSVCRASTHQMKF